MLREMIGTAKKGLSPMAGSPSAYWSSIAHEDAASAVVALVGRASGASTTCATTLRSRDASGSAHSRQPRGIKVPRPMPKLMAMLGGKTTSCSRDRSE